MSTPGPEDAVHGGLRDTVAQQRATISELLTPVLEVWDGVLALPIVGSVDTARAQDMTETLLERIVATGSEIVLLDITGSRSSTPPSPSICSRRFRRPGC
jgi:hypothetical protein